MLIFSTDKPRLQRHFEKDPVKFCYHLGDLDDFYFPHCQWAVDYADRAKIEECVLVYNGGPLPAVLTYSVTDRFQQLLEQMLPMLPPHFFGHYENAHLDLFLQLYHEKPRGTYSRMKLESLKTQSLTVDKNDIIRLDRSHLTDIKKLYSAAYPDSYFIERMLETGKYLGYFDNEKLIAITGIHVDADEYKVACLGNITTHPDHRGKGYSTALTYHLVDELVNEKKLICLNVKADNESAITVYEKLGFVKAFDYEEGIFELK